MSEGRQRRRRRAPADPNTPPPQKRRKKKVPTVDIHLRVELEDMLVRISAADFQRFLKHWVLNGETVILRGPFNGMETDIVLRGTSSGMFSIRSYGEGVQRPKVRGWKLVVASEVMAEKLAEAGITAT